METLDLQVKAKPIKLLTQFYPNILIEWDFAKNKDIDLDNLTVGSNKKVWWTCSQKHEWQAVVADRIRYGTKCPYCMGKLATKEYNLAILYPSLIREWHPTKNSFLPNVVLPKSSKKVWWKCPNNHEWQTAISDRTFNKSGCPYCSGLLASSGHSLLDNYPIVAATWHPLYNDGLIPSQVTPKSTRKVWWKCKEGHEWKAAVVDRVLYTNGCPYCNNNKLSISYNLAIKYPDLMKEWNHEKNMLNPLELGPHSKKLVWWICEKDHEWEMTIDARTRLKQNCPYCSGKRASKDYNLVVLYPNIFESWHPTKNVGIDPYKITPFSSKRVWWICNKDLTHEWETRVQDRVSYGTNCPNCCFLHTNLEKYVEDKLGIQKFNKCVLVHSKIQYRPDFQLSDNLYLNVDGLYWYSELQKSKDYHFSMRIEYESENKRILQFYEDEIYNKWNIVESIINNALGKTANKINARECEIKQVPLPEAKQFYNTDHLMGSYTFAHHFGLYYNNELVSLISIRNKLDILEISRFCTKININIRGGFQRLLFYVINKYTPKQVISYCDLRYATGKSYELAGFKLASITQGWQWTDLSNRYNRLACRAGNGHTEVENAQGKGWIRIYDAGQAKYVLLL